MSDTQTRRSPDRKPSAVQFTALAVSAAIAADDHQCVVLHARTHCGQAVALRMTRGMARGIAAEIARLHGCTMVPLADRSAAAT